MNPKMAKIIIRILSILLIITSAALCFVLIRKYNLEHQVLQTELPDNYITDTAHTDTQNEQGSQTADTVTDLSTDASHPDSATAAATATDPVTSSVKTADVPKNALRLYRGNNRDNLPFHVENMFPGDTITREYELAVSYQNAVQLRFRAEVRPGYELLAQVLKCRVTVVGKDVLYDGLMKDMPAALVVPMKTSVKTTDYVLYEITVYLDTSVGNEYQNADLIADYHWWIEEVDNLLPPETSDALPAVIWATVAAASFTLIVIFLIVGKRRRKEEKSP